MSVRTTLRWLGYTMKFQEKSPPKRIEGLLSGHGAYSEIGKQFEHHSTDVLQIKIRVHHGVEIALLTALGISCVTYFGTNRIDNNPWPPRIPR